MLRKDAILLLKIVLRQPAPTAYISHSAYNNKLDTNGCRKLAKVKKNTV